MTPVLHVSREVADALPAGLSIAPVEGRECVACDGAGKDPLAASVVDSVFGFSSDYARDCSDCGGRGVLPPVLSGRIAVAVDGAIIGTATATDVIAWVGEDGDLSHPGSRCVEVRPAGAVNAGVWLHDHETADDPVLLAADPAALGLSPGQWVVTIEDWAPTTDRCPNPRCESGWVLDCDECADAGLRLAETDCSASGCPVCRREESCPPVPVATAPVGTVTTWEAT